MQRLSSASRSHARHGLTALFAAPLLWAGVALSGANPVLAAGSFTCAGGSPSSPSVIPAGTYSSVVVTGFCVPAAGTVTVRKSFTVARGAGFDSMTASSTVTIGGSVDVKQLGELALGCGPSFDTPCPEGPTAVSHDSIAGDLRGEGAALLIIHFDTIGGNVHVSGGGGGLGCANLPGLPIPGYVDFASNTLGHNASVTGLRTCWSGFSNNTVWGNVSWDNNRTGVGDGNFVGDNTIHHNLNCSNDSPRPHLSDLTPVPNTVGRHTGGQCVGEV